MITSKFEQNTEEWLQFRRGKIGASDAPVIMGVSPWKNKLQLWEEKVKGTYSQAVNGAMKRGIELEESARQLFCLKTGIEVFPCVAVHPELDWMMASLDGLDKSGKVAVEIKCAGKEDHAVALAGRVPEKYYPQLQHQMHVCQLEKMFYFSFDGYDGKLVELQLDRSYVKEMLGEEQEFYRCMIENRAPAPKKTYIMREDEPWKECACALSSILKEKKDLEKREAEIKARILNIAGQCESMGYGIKLSRVQRKGQIDYSTIPELEGVNLEEYRKHPTASWVVTLDEK